MSKYTLDYFIAKFEEIPEEQWTTNDYLDEKGRSCALGHLGFRAGSGIIPTEVAALYKFVLVYDLMIINDGVGDPASYASTPKQRVLKHLRALKYTEEKGARDVD